MRQFLKNFVAQEDGATAIEYGLIAAFVALVIVATFPAIRDGLNNTFTTISGALAG